MEQWQHRLGVGNTVFDGGLYTTNRLVGQYILLQWYITVTDKATGMVMNNSLLEGHVLENLNLRCGYDNAEFGGSYCGCPKWSNIPNVRASNLSLAVCRLESEGGTAGWLFSLT